MIVTLAACAFQRAASCGGAADGETESASSAAATKDFFMATPCYQPRQAGRPPLRACSTTPIDARPRGTLLSHTVSVGYDAMECSRPSGPDEVISPRRHWR